MLRIDENEGLTGFQERLLDIAAQTVPDLAEQPLYVVNTPLARARGLYCPGNDRIFRDDICDAQKWHGPGLAVVADVGPIYGRAFAQGHALGLGTAEADRHARLTLAGILLHEFSHGIVIGRDGEETLLADGVPLARRAFRAVWQAAELPPAIKAAPPPVEPWHHGHGAPFIRTACHVAARMRRAFPDLTYNDICSSEAYGVSSVDRYAAALVGELDSTASIRTLLASKAPRAFRDQWRQDVFSWYGNSAKGDEETAAAEAALALVP